MPQVGLDEITEQFLDSLIANRVREDRWLEYKRELPKSGERERKEFAADVSSFANAAGGVLLYGIEQGRDENGTPFPASLLGAAGNTEQACLRVEQMARDCIAPRIPGFRTKAIGRYQMGAVIAIEVPRSWIGPHMVAIGDSRFFARGGAGRFPLVVDQIREQFALSESVPTRLRRFRDERLLVIEADEAPVRLGPSGRVVLHVVPFDALNPYQPRDVTRVQFNRGLLHPLGVGFDVHRFNLDGYFTGTHPGTTMGGQQCGAYALLFRSGAIEQVESFALRAKPGERPTLAPRVVENEILEVLAIDLKLLAVLGLGAPVAICVSLVGVRGAHFAGLWRQLVEFDRDVIRLPEVVLQDLAADLVEEMRPIFDALWQAGGLEGSDRYAN